MGISAKIKALLSLKGRKQADLMSVLEMGSKQSLSNKFSNERWSAEDLIRIAEFTGCQLMFLFPNGERILLGPEEKAPDE